MKTIFKYDVGILEKFELSMPAGAKILCLQVQREIPRIWVSVELPGVLHLEVRKFCIIGTGKEFNVPSAGIYIGTFQVNGGDLVWHLFEI